MLRPTKVKLLDLCRVPRRYAELRNILDIKDPALQKHLKDLTYYGYIEKQADGTYKVTEDGERLLQIEASEFDSSKIDETLFEAISKKLKLAKSSLAFGETSTPLQRLSNMFPSMAGPDKVKLRKDQVAILRRLVVDLLSRLEVRIHGVDMNTMSEVQKVRILNNMLDSLGVIMSYYKSKELLDRKYEAGITLDMTGIKEEDRRLMASALFWVFKYKSLFSSY
jgi:DNA-binding MarR family transcriptional regulator